MSFIFSREREAESLEESCSAIDASEPSRSIPTPSKSCSPGSGTDCYRSSPCSATSASSMLDPTAAELTSWLAAFPARTSAELAAAPESKESKVASGWKWHASFAKWSPDTSSWRTRQCSLLGDSEEFSETWPRWGSMRDGECLAHTTPELPTSEKGSGFWPTIRASDGERGGRGDLLQAVRGNANSHYRMWSTPVASDTGHRKKKYAQGGTALSMQAGGPLNPDWTEWLMGWPIKWTELAPSGTDKFLAWRLSHGGS